MTDPDCVGFLQWALPRLRMRWKGFRKVRRQVCKRIERRRRELGLADLAAYRSYLEHRSEEWVVLDTLCRVTISRFYRDQETFVSLEQRVLPALVETALEGKRQTLGVWSAGCGSGEEPYTLALLWELELAHSYPQVRMEILATDTDPVLMRRAREACYGESSLKELPGRWRRLGFAERDRKWCLRPEYGRLVTVLAHDVRADPPGGLFDLLLCRNLVFTYFELELQRELCGRFATSLRPDGALVVGAHETVPEQAGFSPWPKAPHVYRKI
jgi:chemotaxis protein methyltransferase CheR